MKNEYLCELEYLFSKLLKKYLWALGISILKMYR